MQSDACIIGMGVAMGAAIGIALTVASQHAAVWLPLAIGSGLAIAIAIRDRRQGGGDRSFPADRPRQISDH
jgi:uncharacterized membrane protein YoaK (UPF0700 family)